MKKRVAKKKQTATDEFESKRAMREEADKLVADYLKKGGQITKCPEGKTEWQ